jgi:hypothetical protein
VVGGAGAPATDYVSRSETLSRELSGSEVNWSFGRPVDPAALDRAFDPRTGPRNPVALPPPRVVVPKKPLPSMWRALGVWALLSLLAFLAAAALMAVAERRPLLTQTASFAAEATPERPPQPATPDSDSEVAWSPGTTERTVVLGSFEVRTDKDLGVRVESPVGLAGDLYLKLVNDGTGETRVEPIGPTGTRLSREYDSPGPGQYTLYAVRSAAEGAAAESFTVTVTEDVADPSWAFVVSFLLLIGPGLLLLMKMARALFSE